MRHSLTVGFATLLVIVVLVFHVTTALATVGYNGSGYWSSSSLTYKVYATGAYGTAASNALSTWSSSTDLTLTATAPGYENIAVYTWAGLETDPFGTTKVCTTEVCPWDEVPQMATYTYAEALGNTTKISSWSSSKLQYLFAHEIGHTLSLGHGSLPYELMWGGGCCTTFDDYDVYQPTSAEINAINARY
jgi:hypothetical protein